MLLRHLKNLFKLICDVRLLYILALIPIISGSLMIHDKFTGSMDSFKYSKGVEYDGELAMNATRWAEKLFYYNGIINVYTYEDSIESTGNMVTVGFVTLTDLNTIFLHEGASQATLLHEVVHVLTLPLLAVIGIIWWLNGFSKLYEGYKNASECMYTNGKILYIASVTFYPVSILLMVKGFIEVIAIGVEMYYFPTQISTQYLTYNSLLFGVGFAAWLLSKECWELGEQYLENTRWRKTGRSVKNLNFSR